MLLAMPGIVMAATAADDKVLRTLDQIHFATLPDKRVEIRLGMTGQPLSKAPLSFSIDRPARIALDLPETASTLERRQDIGMGQVRSVNVVSAKGRTRVVINLDNTMPYETRLMDNELAVILGAGDTDTVSAPVSTPASSASAETESAPTFATTDVEQPAVISKVDFHRGKNGEGLITIELPDSNIAANVHDEGDKIIVDFARARLNSDLERRLDVVDFATIVHQIDSFNRPQGARIIVTAPGPHEHLAYQADREFTLEVKKKVVDAKTEAEESYKGDRLSLNFQDIDVRAVLQIIADFTKTNLVTSDSVTGKVTLRLQNVPWDQALALILKAKGLAKRDMGNVILVAPAEEIAKREKQEFEAKKQVEDLAPLHSALIHINYAKAEDIASLLKAKENTMLSPRGNVTVDDRTNALLLKDTAEKLDEIRKLVDKLDIPVQQVLVESRIVVANDDFSKELGARFGATGVASKGANGGIGLSGSLDATDTITSSAPAPFTMPTLANRLGVNLPAATPAGQIALSILSSDYLVDLELSAMQAEGRGEVLSNPRVITSNQTEARIEQGVEIPYLEASSSGAATVSFKKAVLSLKVKPHITPDGHVVMDLAVNKDSVGTIYQNVPSVNTREVTTQVLVNNGETIVLGGIYEQNRLHEVSKVPLLGDIPILGRLFQKTTDTNNKAELLIFVTPKILKENQALPQ
ncbi:MAG: type IV pilus secretin PilQ [Gammaproteobacteria bacterium]|nr:type IV pilus secretin PilQ [Gammaproteobacteria bacterium]